MKRKDYVQLINELLEKLDVEHLRYIFIVLLHMAK